MFTRMVSTLVAALVAAPAWPLWAQDDGALERRGRVLLAENCSRCHAIGRTGSSPHREAPLFRTLGRRYAIGTLAETLAEGLYTGHPDMPEFVFEIDEVNAILAYLHAIQDPKSGHAK
jgi:mono/diheme cytochrome c family protein